VASSKPPDGGIVVFYPVSNTPSERSVLSKPPDVVNFNLE